MAITAISVLRRDPALANASGLIAGATGPAGAQGQAGASGPAGSQGQPGLAGRGIAGVGFDANGHLIVTYSDGSTSDAGTIAAPQASRADGGTF